MSRGTDNRGWGEVAMAIGYTLLFVLALAVLATCAGCATWVDRYPTEVRVFAAKELREPVVGRNPTGNILVTQPLPGYAEASFLHISSMPSKLDLAEVNQFGFGFCVKVPLRRCNE